MNQPTYEPATIQHKLRGHCMNENWQVPSSEMRRAVWQKSPTVTIEDLRYISLYLEDAGSTLVRHWVSAYRISCESYTAQWLLYVQYHQF